MSFKLMDESGQRVVFFSQFDPIDRFTPSYNSLWPNSGPVSWTVRAYYPPYRWQSSSSSSSSSVVLVALFDCDRTKAGLGCFFLLGKLVERRCPVVGAQHCPLFLPSCTTIVWLSSLQVRIHFGIAPHICSPESKVPLKRNFIKAQKN